MITYQQYDSLVDEMSSSGLNITNNLPVKLKELYPGICLPQNIHNLSRKVRTYLNNPKNDPSVLIPGLEEPKPYKLGPFCDETGITEDILNSGDPITIDSGKKCKGLVYELEKHRKMKGIPWAVALEWLRMIWGPGCKPSTSALCRSWSYIYDKVTTMKKTGKDPQSYLDELYTPPQAALDIKAKLSNKLTEASHKVLQGQLSNVSCNPGYLPISTALSIAQAQGQVMGEHVSKVQSQLTATTSELDHMQQCVKDMNLELEKSNKKVFEQGKLITSQKTDLYNKEQQIEQQTDKLKKLTSHYKVRNVKRREETQKKKIGKLQSEINIEIAELGLELEEKEADLNKSLEETEIHEAEMNKKDKLIDETKRAKLNALKRASKWHLKANSERENISEEIDAVKQEKKKLSHVQRYLENENQVLSERIEELLKEKEVVTFQSGKYNDDIREICMYVLSKGVGINVCEDIVRNVVKKLMNVDIGRLPKKSRLATMKIECDMLAKLHAGNVMLETENNTLHIDGSKKKFTEYSSIDITTQQGQFSLGLNEMISGTSESYMDTTKDTMCEIAHLLCVVQDKKTSEEKYQMLGKLLLSFKNLITDRHIVNKVYHNLFEQYRANFLPLLSELDLSGLSQDEKDSLVKVNHLFCALHVVHNIGTVAKTALKDFESAASQSKIGSSGFVSAQSRTVDLLYELSKAFSVSHNYQKAGMADMWELFLADRNRKNIIVSGRGERINIIFLMGGAAFYHKHDIVEFIKAQEKPNLLLTSCLDIGDPIIQAAVQSLGIFDKLLTGPLMRIIESDDATHVFSLNSVWENIVKCLSDFAKDPTPLLEQTDRFALPVHRDDVYNSLFDESLGDCVLTKECLKLLCFHAEVLVRRQVDTQLPGGKFYSPSPDLIAETEHVPKHNILNERSFALLDRHIREKPHSTTVTLSGTISYGKNNTDKWLSSLPTDEKHKVLAATRKETKEYQKRFVKRREQIRSEKLRIMKEKADKVEEKKERLLHKKEKLTAEIQSSAGGLWTTKENMMTHLKNKNDKEQESMIKAQMRYRKQVLKQHSSLDDKKLLNITNSFATLKQNMETVLSLGEPQPYQQQTASVSVVRDETERVAIIQEVMKKRKKDGKPPVQIKKLRHLVGKSILHQWLDDDGKVKWYKGKVLRQVGGTEEFVVKYENEEDEIQVDLYEDLERLEVVVLEV